MRNELYLEWSSKNIGELQDQLTANKKAWWKCQKGHEWEETICNRNNKNIGCPYCSGRRACEENCLSTRFPALALEWSSKNKLTTQEVTSGTHKKYWWKCQKGHEWESSVVKRTGMGRGCPFCSNQRVCEDNSLENFPLLVNEWHPTKNGILKPKDFVYGSCKKVWWLCNCGFSWQATPSKRTKSNTGCPLCKSSRGEKFIATWLKHENIEFQNQFTFNDCKNKRKLPFDFYIQNMNICIEYHGEQHYKPIPYFGGLSKFEKVKKRDQIKIEYCKLKEIRLLIIPYWKFESLRIILKEFIYA